MIEVLITGAGSGLCDSILEAIDVVQGDYRLRLIDSMESAGEARRFQGRTIVIELDTEADLSTADLVLDLNQTYSGDAEAFRPQLSLVMMLQRLLSCLEPGSVRALHGAVREPAVEQAQGVEALASQVTQLFNGRDPEPKPFGGTLAFNARTLDETALVAALPEIDALTNASISLERWQSDSFYTVHASLWIQLDEKGIASLLSLTNQDYVPGLSVSPDSGRVDHDADMMICARRISDDWVHLILTADLEKTIWAHEAKRILSKTLGVAS